MVVLVYVYYKRSFFVWRKKKVKFFDLELPDHSRLFDRDKSELYSFLTEDCDYLFIDEFQYFENASKLFKAIYDDRRINVKVIELQALLV